VRRYTISNPSEKLLSTMTLPFEQLAGLVKEPVEPILVNVSGMAFLIPIEVIRNCMDQEKVRHTPYGPIAPAPDIPLMFYPSPDPCSD
jgi:hypothetical protein